ncbi:RNA methyltransferase [Robertmurraya sp. DFI.2.37]|uniref:TrmH family RNA methyltransferase n=1 Tax=Robertmurraya sp. DFI.2.37 TaxID=3031819 RepID=UPI0012440C64|nr:RNA methyltransferase [Robertmurraya sp. DFI.2.37]MDF1506955.1 RNA methyltransferase [Robertmurraya sp. DFI.2.37]
MKYIQSAQNRQVKQWKKLLTKKERDKTGTFLVEGFHLVEEAIKADVALEIIISEGVELPPQMDYRSISLTMVTSEIFRELSDTETPQGVLALCEAQKKGAEFKGKQFLLIDAVQDPGNLGTMIRTADAAGMDGVIVGHGSVDIYNPKVIRSAQGSHFHLPVVRGSLKESLEKLLAENIPVYGTSLENGSIYTEISPSTSFALLVGNEGSGVDQELLQMTTKNLYIPLFGKSESLNVAVAAGILLYYLKA